MAILLAHLLKWQYQAIHPGFSWECTINEQRIMISRRLSRTPSLKPHLNDAEFWQEAWADGCRMAECETGMLNSFHKSCPCSAEQVMHNEFWPD